MPGNPEIKTAQDWARANKSARRIAYALILGCIVTFAMGQTILFTLLGPLGRDIGLQEYQVGLITTFSGLAMALVQPAWGRRSDHLGRKTVIVFGLMAYGVTTSEIYSQTVPDPVSGRQKFNVHVLLEVSDSDLKRAQSDFVRRVMAEQARPVMKSREDNEPSIVRLLLRKAGL